MTKVFVLPKPEQNNRIMSEQKQKKLLWDTDPILFFGSPEFNTLDFQDLWCFMLHSFWTEETFFQRGLSATVLKYAKCLVSTNIIYEMKTRF